MQVHVPSRALADAVAWAMQAVPARPAIPLLGCIPIRATDGHLTLSGFDYEQSARVTVDAVTTGGAEADAVVSGRLLAEVVKSLPNGDVGLTFTDTGLTVVCGAARFTLRVVAGEEYPQLPALPALAGHIDGAVLAAAVERVAFATRRDDAVPALCAVNIESATAQEAPDGPRLHLWATDRYRIPVASIPWEPVDASTILRASVFPSFLASAAKHMSGEAKVAVHADGTGGGEAYSSVVGLDTGQRSATGRTLGGFAPFKWRDIIGAVQGNMAVTFDVAQLAGAVTRVSVCADTNQPVQLAFTPGTVTVSVASEGAGDATETIAADVGGAPMTVLISPHYLLDALNSVRSPRALFEQDSPVKVIRLTPAGANDDPIGGFRHALMPVRPDAGKK